MRHDDRVNEFTTSSLSFQKVLAGKVTIEEFFTKGEFAEDKENFMRLYKKVIDSHHFFSDENVAAAWITKLRYNQDMTHEQFKVFINRSQDIFSGKFDQLNLTTKDPEKNDLCAIMWGIEALNGIQNYDTGATRVRLPEGIAPKIIIALTVGGAVFRESTHATGTKLIDKGLSKDLNKELMRTNTPRGAGSLLVIPTSPDGTGSVSKITGSPINLSLPNTNYDLLLKREDYGFNDNITHSLVHTKIGFLNHLRENRSQYQAGMTLINNKSDLAKNAENIWGKSPQIHRKEHLSELKNQSETLVNLLDTGKKEGLFSEFTTKWYIRIKWPPFEKKIVSVESAGRKGLGDFLHKIAEAEKQNPQFAQKNQKELDKVRSLITQAEDLQAGSFQHCREGNEVLVNCQSGKAILVEALAKNTDNSEVNRVPLVASGIVSETNPEMNIKNQKSMKESLGNFKKSPEVIATPEQQFSYKSKH